MDIPPIGVDMVVIKIKNEELNLEETFETKNGGVVASEQKYAFGTKFTVEVTKVGWELLTNVDEGITVTADEKEITFKMTKETVSEFHFYCYKHPDSTSRVFFSLS